MFFSFAWSLFIILHNYFSFRYFRFVKISLKKIILVLERDTGRDPVSTCCKKTTFWVCTGKIIHTNLFFSFAWSLFIILHNYFSFRYFRFVKISLKKMILVLERDTGRDPVSTCCKKTTFWVCTGKIIHTKNLGLPNNIINFA